MTLEHEPPKGTDSKPGKPARSKVADEWFGTGGCDEPDVTREKNNSSPKFPRAPHDLELK